MTRTASYGPWRLTGYMLLAFFSSLLTFAVFILIQDYDLAVFQRIMEFRGEAPDQYRIVPYLVLKGFTGLLELLEIRAFSLKVAIIIFNFFFLATSYILLWNIFPLIENRLFDLLIVLFSFIYPIAMLCGFRPVTSFYVFLVSIGLLIIMSDKGKEKFLLIFIFLMVFCFSRMDLAFFIGGLFCIYIIKDRKKQIIIMLLPFISFIFLKYILFPESHYYTSVVKLKYNFSSSLVFLLYFPMTYLLVGLFCIYRKQVSEYLKYVFRCHQPLTILVGLYLLAVLFFGNIYEFRLWIPFFPVIFFLLNHRLLKLDGPEMGRDISSDV